MPKTTTKRKTRTSTARKSPAGGAKNAIENATKIRTKRAIATATKRSAKPAITSGGRPSKKSSTSRSATAGTASPPGKSPSGISPARLIDGRIKELGDWRGEMLSRLRALIKQVIPDVVEEWKWRGVPVWYHDGMLCTGETYQAVVKVTFARGAALADPSGLFNSSLGGNLRRAIDFHQGDRLDEKALKALFRAAADLNSRDSRPAQRPD